MKTRIGHYDILAELGRGGMGVVYKGHEPALDRYVAIKMLATNLSHDAGVKERFLREARSMAALNDAHIIQIYFIGEEDNQPYFAMEFVDGESLSSYLKREGRVSATNAAKIVYETARGLAGAHDKGVIHRDIKPANLMLTTKGSIKIADFGIALSSQDFAKKLTSTGEFVGTPGYLSPEVCTGNPVDQRSDIFSLGIVLFELLTGRLPFTDESPLGLLLEVVRAEIPDVRELNADVPAELVAVLKKMTAKDPAQRYQSCHELIAELERQPQLLTAGPLTIKPRVPTIAAAAISSRDMAQLPVSRPSPSPANVPQEPAPAAAMPPPAPAAAPAARPSVLERSEQKKGGSGLLWPIAAVLVLGAVGASGYAFRDKLPFVGGSATTASTTTSAADSVRALEASIAPPPAPTPAPTPPPAPPAPAGDAGAAASPPPVDLAAVVGGASDPSRTTNPADANVAQPGANDGAPPRPIAGVNNTDPSDAANLQPLKRIADARRDALLAKAELPSQIAPVRTGPPKVAVIALGDPTITGPAAHALENALSEKGFVLLDSELTPGIERLKGRADLPAILAALSKHSNVRAVTVVRAEPLGTQQLNYYGQSSTLYSVNLSVKTYDVDSRSPVNAGFMSKVDFTSLNANEKAEEAVEEDLSRYVRSLERYRPNGKSG